MTTGAEPARVTYREVLRVREFRAILGAQALSVIGDQLARLAIAYLVFERTGSPLAAASSYALTFLTWVVGGPVLSAAAERYPRRTVMVSCDLVRAGLVALVALPSPPLWFVFLLLIATSLLSPPFEASRSALVSEVLDRDRYIVANGLLNSVFTLGQVAGFALGGAVVAGLGVRSALLLDAATFMISASLLIPWVKTRPAPAVSTHSSSLLAQTRDGARLVMGDLRLRRLLTVAALGMCIVISAEGLAVPVADELGVGPRIAGLLTAAVPFGFLIGSLVLARAAEAARRRSIPYLLGLSAVPLGLSALTDDVVVILALWTLAGVGSGLQVVINAEYVLATPSAYRARAFGVAASVLMGAQGLALLLAGSLAVPFSAQAAVAVLAVAFGVLSVPFVAHDLFDTRLTQGNPESSRGVP